MSKSEVEDVVHRFEKGTTDEPGCHHPAAFRGFSQDWRKGMPAIAPPMSRTLGGNCGNRGSLRLELEPVRKG